MTAARYFIRINDEAMQQKKGCGSSSDDDMLEPIFESTWFSLFMLGIAGQLLLSIPLDFDRHSLVCALTERAKHSLISKEVILFP